MGHCLRCQYFTRREIRQWSSFIRVYVWSVQVFGGRNNIIIILFKTLNGVYIVGTRMWSGVPYVRGAYISLASSCVENCADAIRSVSTSSLWLRELFWENFIVFWIVQGDWEHGAWLRKWILLFHMDKELLKHRSSFCIVRSWGIIPTFYFFFDPGRIWCSPSCKSGVREDRTVCVIICGFAI